MLRDTIDVIGQQVARLVKPRMREVKAFDCGWPYPYWRCEGLGFIAVGQTQEEAYSSWLKGCKFIHD